MEKGRIKKNCIQMEIQTSRTPATPLGYSNVNLDWAGTRESMVGASRCGERIRGSGTQARRCGGNGTFALSANLERPLFEMGKRSASPFKNLLRTGLSKETDQWELAAARAGVAPVCIALVLIRTSGFQNAVIVTLNGGALTALVETRAGRAGTAGQGSSTLRFNVPVIQC